MNSYEVLLRWKLAVEDSEAQRRSLKALISTLSAYDSPPAGLSHYYASRQAGEAWFTAFADDQSVEAVVDRIGAHLPGRLEKTKTDAILGDDLVWYRVRLQHVSEIALEVPDDRQNAAHRLLQAALLGLPDPYLRQDQTRPDVYEDRLKRPLARLAAKAFAKAIASQETGGSFWNDFLRWPHRNADSLSPPGHWLWNLCL